MTLQNKKHSLRVDERSKQKKMLRFEKARVHVDKAYVMSAHISFYSSLQSVDSLSKLKSVVSRFGELTEEIVLLTLLQKLDEAIR